MSTRLSLSVSKGAEMASDPCLRVLQAGMLSTVQDLGRQGQARYGVAPGGALDRRAVILGNRLLGNDPGAAAIEMTLVGPGVEFLAPAIIALTGADLGATLNGFPAPLWQPVAVASGDELGFDPGRGGPGARAYLCIAGGIDVPVVLGSRATDLLGGFGGFGGRALRQGDELSLLPPELEREVILSRRLAHDPPDINVTRPIRVIPGPQIDRFTPDGIAAFSGGTFTVTGKSNRQGIRLSGLHIEHQRGPDLVSEGIAHGAIQVPGDGQPIILLASRQTVGGYVKIATVIGADLDRLAQVRTGDPVRFEFTDVAAARAAVAAYQDALGPGAVVDSLGRPRRGGLDGLKMLKGGNELERVSGDWDPDGVVRVLEAVERTGVQFFRLEVERAGISLVADRRGGEAVEQVLPIAELPSQTVVPAPVIGVFYRRTSPESPPLVEPGDHVEAGQPVCVLEVMKTYHEVLSPTSGVLSEFLVEDGQFVEYGQSLCRINPT